MAAKQHSLLLSAEERRALEQVSRNNRCSVREKTRARLLLARLLLARLLLARLLLARLLLDSDTGLAADQGGSQSDLALAARFKVNPLTVANVRRRAHERGAVASLVRGHQSQRKARRLDGAGEAQLVAITCSAPPAGCASWTLRLLRERLVELDVVEHIGLETLAGQRAAHRQWFRPHQPPPLWHQVSYHPALRHVLGRFRRQSPVLEFCL